MSTMLCSQKSFPPSHYGNFSEEKVVCDSYQRSKSAFFYGDESERSISPDEIDNPDKVKSSSNESLFEIMKLEINRLNSYTGKWPLNYVKPEQLAENGFFYLQSEDKVQCAFCHVIIDDWNVGQKPRREHMKKSPRCPFIWDSKDIGNVPLPPAEPVKVVSKVNPVSKPSEINFSPYKPKHPRMSDLKKRLMTYKDWPLIMLSSRQLAECGLYYTGVADVVTCFFCGGSLGNWDLTDDPFDEHTKFFPNCSYLSLIGHRRQQHPPALPSTQLQTMPQAASGKCNAAINPTGNSNSFGNEIIKQASEIFPAALVQKVVLKHLKENGRQFSSLVDLCEAVLEYKEMENSASIPQDVTGHSNPDVVCSEPVKTCEYTEKPLVAINEEPAATSTKEVNDYLLCKICMDREKGVVFQPCGHLVSCPKCAQLIFDCPLCRTPVTSKVRTYLS